MAAAPRIPPFAMPMPLTPTGPGALGAFSAPPAKPAAPAPPAIDPSNDITCWHEQYTEDGSNRRFWYNSVTLVSTFEKPFCLKTPEERSIPPCPWKEYSTPEGKIYYSDGQESM
jgi:pre-mRNA-processing factor 40